jgi:hypothetical protein
MRWMTWRAQSMSPYLRPQRRLGRVRAHVQGTQHKVYQYSVNCSRWCDHGLHTGARSVSFVDQRKRRQGRIECLYFTLSSQFRVHS